MENETRYTAQELNQHLADGGVVQVTTSLRSWLFEPKHAGMFVEKDGSLHMKRGRSLDCLSIKDRLIVAIRCGRYVSN